jgi:aminoglycoside phosphotransferase
MDPVDAALAAAFPDRAVRDVEPTGPSWNEANETVRVAFADGTTAYLKVARDGDGTRFARERAVTTYVAARTKVPVPEVSAVDPDGDPPYLVTAPVDGEPLLRRWDVTDDAGRRRLASEVGRALARLHGLRFDGHGRFDGGGADGLTFERRPWPELLAADVREMRERAPSPRFPAYYDDLLAAIEANRDRLADAPAALLHGDPARPNAVVADGRVGFLDWERAHAGDPVRELCRARDQQFAGVREPADPAIVDAFHDGYRAVAGSLPAGYTERRPVYDAVRLAAPVGYFDNYLEFAGLEETAFADWLREEMDDRLAALA